MNPAGIHLIAACGLSGQIGLRGGIPWHGDPLFAAHTKRDLEQFARMTAGGVLIMGHATAQSLPKGFVPGGRELIVWKRDSGEPLNLLRDLHQRAPYRDIWICGGEKTYRTFIPFVDWHHISVIPYDGPADRFLPPILPHWSPV